MWKGELAWDDPRHGTVNGYSNLSCRCADCREAWRRDRAVARAKRWGMTAANGGVAPGPRTHGRSTTYTNWGCTCPPCRAAHAHESLTGRHARESRAKNA